MEVGSPDLSTVPSWVILDKEIYRKDLPSSLDDRGVTSASARASNDEDIRVSFILTALPGTSRLCLHCSEDREMWSFDTVVAAHGEAVLFRLKIDYERLLPPDSAIDYFIYWAGPSGPKLTLLPRWYKTEMEILAAEKDGLWNRNQRITMGTRGTGLLLTGCEGEFVVAELQLNVDKLGQRDAPLEGKLIKLCSDREAVATGTDEWEVKYTTARGGKAKFGDLCGWWKTHVVLPYGSYLCWVDYFRGIIFCNVNHDSPDLQYLPLPLETVPIGYPDPLCIALPEAYRAVCITKDGTMKFVNIVRDDGMLFVSSDTDSGFTISLYTLMHHGYDEMKWQKGATIKASELWAMEGYDIHLPRITPQFPLLSMDEPSIIYFVLALNDGTKTWVVALDTGSKKVLWNREIRAIPSDEDLEMSSYNIFCNMPFFPCEFSKYLQKAAPRCEANIKRANGGDLEIEDFKEMLRNFCSEDLCKFQKAMEQTSILKKEASDKRLKCIESDRMTRMEEYLLGIQEEVEHLKVRHNEVSEKLCEAKEHNENLQAQFSGSRGQYEWLLSDHDYLLHRRDHAVREVEDLQLKRGQMLSVLSTSMCCEFSLSELQRATENFSSSLKIGEGGFGYVFRGILQNMTVAIKVLKPDSLQGQSQFEQQFKQEVAILSRVRHPHLVTLLGACSESSTLVYEFLPNGSLEEFLRCAVKRRTLQWQIRIRIIAEICSALIFLHKNKPHPVVHGDLKPANILLDVNLVSKLSDFGISRLLIQSSTSNTKHPLGTCLDMDPEFFATGELTPHSDVYSFGVVVLRLLTGKPPVGIKKIVEDALDKGDLKSIIDASAGEWPVLHVLQLTHLALSCTELSRRCRPDLSSEVWGLVEAMRDAARLSSASSSRSVPREICTPSYFICPISQEVMNDPHIAADGFTYEAEAIRCWLDSGHDTSPMTNLRLEHDELVPNRALRSAIQEWLQQRNMEL